MLRVWKVPFDEDWRLPSPPPEGNSSVSFAALLPQECQQSMPGTAPARLWYWPSRRPTPECQQSMPGTGPHSPDQCQACAAPAGTAPRPPRDPAGAGGTPCAGRRGGRHARTAPAHRGAVTRGASSPPAPARPPEATTAGAPRPAWATWRRGRGRGTTGKEDGFETPSPGGRHKLEVANTLVEVRQRAPVSAGEVQQQEHEQVQAGVATLPVHTGPERQQLAQAEPLEMVEKTDAFNQVIGDGPVRSARL